MLVVNEVDEVTLLHAYATKSFQVMSFKTLYWKVYSQWLMTVTSQLSRSFKTLVFPDLALNRVDGVNG